MSSGQHLKGDSALCSIHVRPHLRAASKRALGTQHKKDVEMLDSREGH